MFVPPEDRQPPPQPSKPEVPTPRMTQREEAVLLWVVGLLLVSIVLAPIGGSTVLEALRYLFRP